MSHLKTNLSSRRRSIMNHSHKFTRILVTILLVPVVLTSSAGSVVWAGPVEEAGRSLGEYIAIAPGDTEGIEQFRAAINCFALAWEVRRQQLGDLSNGVDGDSYRQKCRNDIIGFDHWDPDLAIEKGLINLTGGLISALVQILQSPGVRQ
jgi:hypothetical protein